MRTIFTLAAAVMTVGCFAESPKIEGGETDVETTSEMPPTTGSSTDSGTGDPGDDTDGDEEAGTSASSDASSASESSSDSGAGPVELPDPLAHWTFDDGDFLDESGNGYHGVLVGNPQLVPTPWGLGVYVCAACEPSLLGAVDVSTISEDFAALPAWTVTTRLNSENWGTLPKTIVGIGEDTGISLRVNQQQVEVWTRTVEGESAVVLGPAPAAGGWHRMTWVVEGTTVAYYTGPEHVGTADFVAPGGEPTLASIAAWRLQYQPILGTIDEVTIYPAALSPEQVEAL